MNSSLKRSIQLISWAAGADIRSDFLQSIVALRGITFKEKPDADLRI